MRSVGVYEAKTHLASLLDQVAQGESITITRHGQPVAVLTPYQTPLRPEVGGVIDALRAFRKGISLGDLTVREAIDEGRRS
ncbi:MAG: type II toxin-antitoxin system prevent-host-death family antitoxin [Chloroflexi bacterium]|nr:type II toxin-antitoxin system prevent-host-death family antitoxin [Chloroflexota bacterium]